MDIYKITCDDGILLHENVNTIKINAGNISYASKGAGLVINAVKRKYMFLSHQNTAKFI
jgi:hypothetical protein